MSDPKTMPTGASVADFLATAAPARRADAEIVQEMMGEITGAPPVMWGPSIVGFGSYRYVYQSGREGVWPLVGFSPRKANLVLYLMPGYEDQADLLARLGKHKIGKSCLYLNKLSDVDLGVLRALIERSVAVMRARHPAG